ncbi:putative quinol monooxygenase [Actinoplanes sp. TFC3]|uniref:putative quinol monooxygenase n=1 Tax=Actinoplanes sp. TFC3 TaxID=1710355 RepID=UPI00082EE15C|nr:antibiotic biosynthesis monooxygenase [Actinoplanes sp. TFC3]
MRLRQEASRAAKFLVEPESAERWPEIAGDFTRATRADPGCLWFDWSRSLDDPNGYVPQHLQATPRIISQSVEQSDWSQLGRTGRQLITSMPRRHAGYGPRHASS